MFVGYYLYLLGKFIFYQKIENELESVLNIGNATDLLLISEQAGIKRLKKACVDLIVNSFDEYKRHTKNFTHLRQMPLLLRELDFICTKRNLTQPGELMTMC